MDSFKDKKVWIIGASSGIGLSLAQKLAQCGAQLILSARNAGALADLNNNLGAQHRVVPFDVADAMAFQAAAAEAGPLDSVILLSAIYTPMALDTLDLVETRKIIDV